MSRKYKQRGYQEEDAPVRERSDRRPERPEGPRGRGLGAPTSVAFRCARCGAAQQTDTAVDYDAVCAGCGSDLRTCTNCRHFDTAALFECRLEIEQRVTKKSTRTECNHFEAKQALESSDEGAQGSDPRSEFDALFKF